ncbi:hypothetical protein AK812_SmicGene104 [Symbiodinium microadriaticum]|uniref:Uncharacterized protein n=1 Tax=Symbiodinium microadriaticum TaxID=2951 RepID=A0A1Q9F7N7_SYMMI|nr:hypothetical protein AK812_SmicGene104 [Symbiodinium microadriaticum]
MTENKKKIEQLDNEPCSQTHCFVQEGHQALKALEVARLEDYNAQLLALPAARRLDILSTSGVFDCVSV